MAGRSIVAAVAAAAAAAVALGVVIRRRRNNGGGRGSSSSKQLDALEAVVLTNAIGCTVVLTPVGAAIQRLLVPVADKQQKRLVDVVLGFNKPSSYARVEGTPYFGAIVGRVANRIAHATFTLDGATYRLARNNGPNALHGGPRGFHTRVWDVADTTPGQDGSQAVTFSYTSRDGEEGYPGTLRVTARYELAAAAPELRVSIRATTDKATPVNIVQHSYFNLAGHNAGDVRGHVVALRANHYTPVDATQIPTGKVAAVAGTPFDFASAPRAVGERFGDAALGGSGYDHNFVLFGLGPAARHVVRNHQASPTPRLAATVTEPRSGLTLDVLTTAPACQLYTGGFLGDGATPDAKDGADYVRFAGLCLETQHVPDAINQPGAFPSPVLRPGETYAHDLVYRFRGAGLV